MWTGQGYLSALEKSQTGENNQRGFDIWLNKRALEDGRERLEFLSDKIHLKVL